MQEAGEWPPRPGKRKSDFPSRSTKAGIEAENERTGKRPGGLGEYAGTGTLRGTLPGKLLPLAAMPTRPCSLYKLSFLAFGVH